MLRDKTICVIGAGQMGEALFRGFLQAGLADPSNIVLSDVNKERLESLRREYGVGIAPSNVEAIERGDIVILAVKPQHMEQTLVDVKGAFTEDKLVISIAAGVTSERILNLIGKNIPVIRVMPNTPALVASGMSVISRGKFADETAANTALTLFSAIGKAIELPESQQNQATAISGSGPAYFFLLVESLIEAGIHAGLSEEAAAQLVTQTFLGSAKLLTETGEPAGTLREKVTSPGGTTAAALQVFQNYKIKAIVQEAVRAAIQRAEELA